VKHYSKALTTARPRRVGGLARRVEVDHFGDDPTVVYLEVLREDGTAGQCAPLTPEQARRVAKWLRKAADEAEGAA
jgi:hypothetical protein